MCKINVFFPIPEYDTREIIRVFRRVTRILHDSTYFLHQSTIINNEHSEYKSLFNECRSQLLTQLDFAATATLSVTSRNSLTDTLANMFYWHNMPVKV